MGGGGSSLTEKISHPHFASEMVKRCIQGNRNLKSLHLNEKGNNFKFYFTETMQLHVLSMLMS